MIDRKLGFILLLLGVALVGAGCALPTGDAPPTPVQEVTEAPAKDAPSTPVQEVTEAPAEDSGGGGLTWEDDLATNPPPPQDVKAVKEGTTVVLKWNPPMVVKVGHSYSDTIVRYRVFRRKADDAESIEVGVTGETTFVDESPPSGQVFYHVTALHEGDFESSRSDEAGAMFDAEETVDVLVELRQVGGFAGLNDHIVVRTGRRASLYDENGTKTTDFQVEFSAFEQVEAAVEKYGSFIYLHDDNPDGPDNLHTELVLNGHGAASSQPSEQEREALIALLVTVLIQGQ